MSKSDIDYVTNTWGLVVGCTPVSDGCDNCWAARLAARQLHPSWCMTTRDSQWSGRIRLRPEVLDQPFAWKKPRRVFVAPMGDLFHEEIPDDFVDRVWARMILLHRHAFLVLTKRPARLRDYLKREWRYRAVLAEADLARRAHAKLYDGGVSCPAAHPAGNIWVGTSCEDQDNYDYRVGVLDETPAAVRWVSVEPMLGAIDLRLDEHQLDWVVVGAESGPRARRIRTTLIEDVVDQCVTAGVPVFVKQAWIDDKLVKMPVIAGRVWAQTPGDMS